MKEEAKKEEARRVEARRVEARRVEARKEEVASLQRSLSQRSSCRLPLQLTSSLQRFSSQRFLLVDLIMVSQKTRNKYLLFW